MANGSSITRHALAGPVRFSRSSIPAWVRPAPWITIALLVGPIVAGMGSALLPAFGFFPAIGGDAFSLDPFRDLFAAPGLELSIRHSIVAGLGSTLIALALTMLLFACTWDSRALLFVRRLVAPLLSVPHAAAAVGLAFLIAPSGFLARLTSPWLTGWDRPPDLLIVNDPMALSMLVGLVAKEMPFLFLMGLAALPQLSGPRRQMVMRSLGYGSGTGFLISVAPQLYRLIRLPVFAVLAYASSVADVALVLGPTTPAPLAVRILEWSSDPDLALRFKAAAGAVLQIIITVGLIGIWMLGERIVGRLWLIFAMSGRQSLGGKPARRFGLIVGLSPMLALGLGLLVLLIWSVSGPWRFPDALPAAFSLRPWTQSGADVIELAAQTMIVALVPTLVALVLIIGCLEVETAMGRGRENRALWVLYLPLIVPQVTFLFGLQFIAIVLDVDGMAASVMAVHLLFVLPYMFLSLADPWRSFDNRVLQVAATLGLGSMRRLVQVRLPMMIAPLLTALAIGIATSIGQYLPTLLIGAGRVPTLTTEAVALAAGGDRRALAVAATLQALLPFVAYWIALVLPAFLARNRRGMRTS